MSECFYPTHGLKGKRYFIVYNTLYRMQEGKCAICGYKVGDIWIFGNKVYKLMIDHSHVTGRIRGLLCNGCNTLVGNYERGIQTFDPEFEWPIADYEAKIEAYVRKK
jgi:hypothetical protein